MISSRQDLRDYIAADARASGRKSVKAKFFGDEVWKYTLLLRRQEYYANKKGLGRKLTTALRFYYRIRRHNLGLRLGFSIPLNAFGKGLSIAHYGTIVVANSARIGENCRIHEGVTIGATNGESSAATIGNNVFIATGAKIIGKVSIADDVAIAANAVVTDSITEKGTTWGGVPARKISDSSSRANLNKAIFE